MSFEKKSQPIRELMNSPNIDGVSNALTKSTEGLEPIAPNVAQSLKMTTSRALNYLHQALPKAQSEFIGDRDYEPSQTEQRQWLHKHEIINDPLSVLDHIRHGSLTPSHMDALSQVHPELLDQMKQKVMENMDPKRVKKLPSSTKAALGLFMGSPVQAQSTPQAIMANQMTFLMSGSQSAMRTPKATVGGLKELKLGERSATETTNLEEQK